MTVVEATTVTTLLQEIDRVGQPEARRLRQRGLQSSPKGKERNDNGEEGQNVFSHETEEQEKFQMKKMKRMKKDRSAKKLKQSNHEMKPKKMAQGPTNAPTCLECDDIAERGKARRIEQYSSTRRSGRNSNGEPVDSSASYPYVMNGDNSVNLQDDDDEKFRHMIIWLVGAVLGLSVLSFCVWLKWCLDDRCGRVVCCWLCRISSSKKRKTPPTFVRRSEVNDLDFQTHADGSMETMDDDNQDLSEILSSLTSGSEDACSVDEDFSPDLMKLQIEREIRKLKDERGRSGQSNDRELQLQPHTKKKDEAESSSPSLSLQSNVILGKTDSCSVRVSGRNDEANDEPLVSSRAKETNADTKLATHEKCLNDIGSNKIHMVRQATTGEPNQPQGRGQDEAKKGLNDWKVMNTMHQSVFDYLAEDYEHKHDISTINRQNTIVKHENVVEQAVEREHEKAKTDWKVTSTEHESMLEYIPVDHGHEEAKNGISKKECQNAITKHENLVQQVVEHEHDEEKNDKSKNVWKEMSMKHESVFEHLSADHAHEEANNNCQNPIVTKHISVVEQVAAAANGDDRMEKLIEEDKSNAFSEIAHDFQIDRLDRVKHKSQRQSSTCMKENAPSLLVLSEIGVGSVGNAIDGASNEYEEQERQQRTTESRQELKITNAVIEEHEDQNTTPADKEICSDSGPSDQLVVDGTICGATLAQEEKSVPSAAQHERISGPSSMPIADDAKNVETNLPLESLETENVAMLTVRNVTRALDGDFPISMPQPYDHDDASIVSWFSCRSQQTLQDR